MSKQCSHIDTHTHLWSNKYLDKLALVGSPHTEIAKNMELVLLIQKLKKEFK